MAVVTRYVNTASTAGGDGTTNATAGANRAYASLSEWEAAEQADLVAAGDTHIVHCEGSTADSTACTVTGWTTGASNYITIQVDTGVRHDGNWDTTAYRLDGTGDMLYIYETETRVIGVQSAGSSTSFRTNTTDNIYFEACIANGAANNGNWGWYLYNGGGFELKNCLGFTWNRAFSGHASVDVGGALYVNCTAWDISEANYNESGFLRQQANGEGIVKNCVCFAQDSPSATYGDFTDNYTYGTGTDYNASGDSSAPGSTVVTSLTDSNEFTSLTGTGDFNLKSGNSIGSSGVGPASDSDVLSTDIAGNARSGSTCSIGAFEDQTGGGGTSTPQGLQGLMNGFNPQRSQRLNGELQ